MAYGFEPTTDMLLYTFDKIVDNREGKYDLASHDMY